MSPIIRILLVDDEPAVLQALQRALRAPGLLLPEAPRLHVEAFGEAMAALNRAASAHFDLAVVDYRMPGLDGVQVLKRLRRLQPDCCRVILTGAADMDAMAAAINEARIAHYMTKPWDNAHLLAVLSDLLAERHTRREQDRLAEAAHAGSNAALAIEREAQRLEQLEPGITHVEWGPDGAVLLDLAAECAWAPEQESGHAT